MRNIIDKNRNMPPMPRSQAHLTLQLVSFDNSLGGPMLAKGSQNKAKILSSNFVFGHRSHWSGQPTDQEDQGRGSNQKRAE